MGFAWPTGWLSYMTQRLVHRAGVPVGCRRPLLLRWPPGAAFARPLGTIHRQLPVSRLGSQSANYPAKAYDLKSNCQTAMPTYDSYISQGCALYGFISALRLTLRYSAWVGRVGLENR
jgi:hypothetical protein